MNTKTKLTRCDYCLETRDDVEACVVEEYIQYEPGGAGFDGPVRVGDVCERCREEEFDGKAVPEHEF